MPQEHLRFSLKGWLYKLKMWLIRLKIMCSSFALRVKRDGGQLAPPVATLLS